MQQFNQTHQMFWHKTSTQVRLRNSWLIASIHTGYQIYSYISAEWIKKWIMSLSQISQSENNGPKLDSHEWMSWMGRCDRGRSFNLLQMAEEGVKCDRRGDFDTAKGETQIQHRRRDIWEKKWGRGNFNTAEGGLCFVRKLSPNQVRENMRAET